MPGTPPPALLPPPEGIFRNCEDLMSAVQRVAKEQGYGIVKLRASNYRDGKPTRYDLVCDRGGVKYNSTAKKRNPSTRKIDCPFRAKAVCEVQLGNQWRFALQDPRHNHDARLPAGPTSQGDQPTSNTLKALGHKLDRISQQMQQLTSEMSRIGGEVVRMGQRFDGIDSRVAEIQRHLNIEEQHNLERQNEMDRSGFEPRFQTLPPRLQGLDGTRMDAIAMEDVDTRLLTSNVM